ncbi:MAG: fasciclin domain-containing protein [Ginsengibacter sp.]
MNQSILHKSLLRFLAAAIFFTSIISCNKDLENAVPIVPPGTGGATQTLAEFFAADTNYSFYNAALIKAASFGLAADFNNKDSRFTVFAPDNNAFRRSGISSEAVISGGFTAGQLDTLLRYSIIPGKIYTAADIAPAFPNVQLPSNLTAAAIPGTLLPFNLSVYPSKSATGFYFNNIPVVAADNILANGVVHTVAAIVLPPSKVLAELIYTNDTLNLFTALILRASSGMAADASFDYYLKLPFANFTVFAPDDLAVKTLISILTGGQIPIPAPEQVFLDFIANMLPVQNAQGIVAYHILPSKAFSVNFPEAATYFPTLFNGSFPTHPGVQVDADFTGPFVSAFKVTGVGNQGFASNVTSKDINAVNGVLDIIDQVLLPQ